MKMLPIEKKLLDSLIEEAEAIGAKQEILTSGALVRLLRVGLGMSQRQLAKRASVPSSTILRIEKGIAQPNEATLRKIFAAMECDIAFLAVPHFKSIKSFLHAKAEKLAKKRLRYVEGTMALEHQQPNKTWQERLLENEIELILQSPSQLWDEDAD